MIDEGAAEIETVGRGGGGIKHWGSSQASSTQPKRHSTQTDHPMELPPMFSHTPATSEPLQAPVNPDGGKGQLLTGYAWPKQDQSAFAVSGRIVAKRNNKPKKNIKESPREKAL
ncbi:MAG: hypothetical protein A3E08_00635 [Candidatus Wildermuthbacteria bacterium RIFCSPHIGHO2_12_FULL_49_13]|nr:MAG: hypothetical protein A3E08_00635 [Candidatus Wildermuthbacteria bacterium RIFCSPHIGHO2_12_FULL_49_13]OHA77730.1 MAG: hypothetical protein A2564_03635 [Candidatus Wildermuthbacteria bacterium RIFOXYD1_FULL_50_12]